jgi:peptidoglycan L-alanyl-D-glutamate endopeptidase CwlK
MHRAIATSPLDFLITEGLRTEARQRELVAAGASKTMRSRHLTGHAVDVAVLIGREVRWDWPLYAQLSQTVKAAATAEGVAITWGGDWPRFRDGPHYELRRAEYP